MWKYFHPTTVIFEDGAMDRIGKILEENNLKNGVLVSDPFFAQNGLADKIMKNSDGRLISIYSDVEPNPTVVNVDNCANVLKEQKAEFVLALGGGSAMDCAKAAATTCKTDDSIVKYHGTGVALPAEHLPLIAVPTTAGTGSEVTGVSVLTDHDLNKKAPVVSNNFYPTYAIIDPQMTLSVPPRITASTGLDVLCHAVEAYWSVNHQPICDAMAEHATRLVFKYLRRVVKDGSDVHARTKMCQASVIAGLAFNLPKTTSSHACSYPLTSMFHIAHGEACALTLDYFARVNKVDPRVQNFAKTVGFDSVDAMADEIAQLKKDVGVLTDLKEFNIDEKQLDELVAASHHPNMLNNPIEITDEILYDMYRKMI
ncbi:iron-containing alcohol dehydrogenase family protein [Anaerolentibacter hominis]|uniref:iron-containing alcohol dehydrogenase family protein n=1 Tax=Anaerolentibacter hominis TaxID=3079009 RepID=UPI0031B80822